MKNMLFVTALLFAMNASAANEGVILDQARSAGISEAALQGLQASMAGARASGAQGENFERTAKVYYSIGVKSFLANQNAPLGVLHSVDRISQEGKSLVQYVIDIEKVIS